MRPARPVTIPTVILSTQQVPPLGVHPSIVTVSDQISQSRLVPSRVQVGKTSGHARRAHSIGLSRPIQTASNHDNLKNSTQGNLTKHAIGPEQSVQPVLTSSGCATDQIKQPAVSSNEQTMTTTIEQKRDQLKQTLSANQMLQREIRALGAELVEKFPSVLQQQVQPAEIDPVAVQISFPYNSPPLVQAAIVIPPGREAGLVAKRARAKEKTRALQAELEGLAAELSEITAFARGSMRPETTWSEWQSPEDSEEVSRSGSQEAVTPPKRSPLPQGVFIPPLAIPHAKENRQTPSTSSSEGAGCVIEDHDAGRGWMGLGDVGAEAILLAQGGRAAWQFDAAEPMERNLVNSETMGDAIMPVNPTEFIAPVLGVPGNAHRCPICGKNFISADEAEAHLDNCAEAATLRTGITGF